MKAQPIVGCVLSAPCRFARLRYACHLSARITERMDGYTYCHHTETDTEKLII